MTQEQKAKAYDKALKRAKSMIDDLRKGEDILAISDLESMFPELKESEDEKIRKALIFHYQGDGCICTNEYRIDYKDICAWLEKQGENPTNEEMLEILRTEYEKGRADALADLR